MFTVADIMTTSIHTLSAEASLEDARRLMHEKNIRHIPVVDENNRLEGLVSQRDILAAADSTLVASPTEEGSWEQNVAISNLMTMDVSTTNEHDHLRGAALLMQQHKMGCLPVLRDGELIGIVTDTDFISVAINLMEQLEAVEPADESDLDEDFEAL